jgi:dTDP-glucose 4,6-dehydratase
VYGSLELDSNDKFSETSVYQPNSPYSASKAAADHLVRAWHHTYGLPTVVTHCTNNYGPRQYPEKLIPHMIACALQGKPLPVYGDGLNVRDWIHVEDHARGLMLAVSKGKPGEVYDFGGRAERKNIDLVKALCATLDAKCARADKKSYAEQIAFVTDRLGHDRRYAIDDSKAERELGYVPQHQFEAGLANTVEWYIKNQSWVEEVLHRNKKECA